MQPLKQVDISLESRIVASIVGDTSLLEQTIDIIDPTLFESPTTQIVVEWATDYFRRTKQAPGANMKDVFAARQGELNSADAELVYAYMKRGDWVPADNLEFAKSQLESYIRSRAMNRLVDRLKSKIESGNYKDCERAIAEWQKPEIRKSEVFNLYSDFGLAVETVNRDEDATLFKFQGDLGATVGDFKISDYVLWLAPAKRGKSWWLMKSALDAALAGNKVLFYSLEMDKYEVEDRFLRMLTGCSLDGELAHISVFNPIGDGRYELMEMDTNTRPIDRTKRSLSTALKTAAKYSRGGELQFMCKATNSFSVEDLRSDLVKLEAFDNFVPTVVVIDYVDIMKFQYGNEKRFGLDKLHLELRGLNMERKFCLISASQAGRQNVTGENDVTEADIAECAAKLNHATKIILINQTKDEKKQGIYRINVNMSRHGGVSYETAVCTSCLTIGRPCIDCHRLSSIYNPKDEKDGSKELGYGGFRKGRKSYEE